MTRSLLRDRRGGAMVQLLVLVSAVGLAGFASYKALGDRTSERADCAGKSVAALSTVPCKEGDEGAGKSVSQPPPAPEASEGGEPEEFDPLKELKDLALEILGVTDAVKCFTEGDILACVMTVISFSPFKLIGIIGKLASNAKRIANAVERLKKARQAKKAADDARKAKQEKERIERAEKAKKITECEGIHAGYKALGDCRKCKRTDTAEERASKVACITAESSGRIQYLAKKCDYILPGSIAKGSADAERGHQERVGNLATMLANCSTLPTQ